MLIERIKQQLRIIETAHRYFGVCEGDIKFTIEHADNTWRYVHDYVRTVLSVDYGISGSTDTRFVSIRNHVTGVGYLYNSVSDDEFTALEQELRYGN